MQTNDPVIDFIRDEFDRLYARLDHHMALAERYRRITDRHESHWRVLKRMGAALTALAGTFLAWLLGR